MMKSFIKNYAGLFLMIGVAVGQNAIDSDNKILGYALFILCGILGGWGLKWVSNDSK